MMWQKIRVTVRHRLHQRRAILANHDIQRDMFPPISWPMTLAPTNEASAMKLRGKKTLQVKKFAV